MQRQAVQCVICAGAHKVEDHRCGVTGYTVKMGKVCTYVTSNYANCRAKHQATAFKYQARLKTQAEAWKENLKNSKSRINSQPLLQSQRKNQKGDQTKWK